MPTPVDLREALDRLEAEAPADVRTRAAVLRHIEAAERSRCRRRWTPRAAPLLVAAAVLVVALATVVVLAIRGADGVGEPLDRPTASLTPLGPPPPATGLAWAFDLPDAPAGTEFRRISISKAGQMGVLERTDGAASLMIIVHEPGAFDPVTEMQQPQPVTVAGRAGFFGPVRERPVASLVWPTPAGGWAQLDGFGVVTNNRSEKSAEPAQVLGEQLSVAPLVRFGRFDPPRLPFRLGWFPAGLSVLATAIDPTFGSAFFADAGPTTLGIGTIGVGRIDQVAGSFAEEIDGTVGPDRTTLTVDGRPAVLGPASEFEARVLAVDLGDGSAFLVFVGDSASDRYPLDVMRRIAEKADVSMPMDDLTAWIPAPDAVNP